MNLPAESDKISAGVRRLAGIAALRRIGALVERERAQDAANAAALPRVVGGLLLLIGVCLLYWLLQRGGA